MYYCGRTTGLSSLTQWLGRRAGSPSRFPQDFTLALEEDMYPIEEEEWEEALGVLHLCLPSLISLELAWSIYVKVGASPGGQVCDVVSVLAHSYMSFYLEVQPAVV